ncbi:MAG: GntR family transcriptional regulator [Bacillota bacterium]
MPRIKSNLADNIFNTIVERINKYTYTAGDVISEVALAEEFNISRTPVREAILKLIDAGLLTRNKTKIVVKPLKIADIKEVLDARLSCEVMSIHTVFERGGFTKEEIDHLTNFHNGDTDCLSNNHLDRLFELDTEFHDAIISCSHNSRIIDFMNKLNLELDRFRRITMLTPTRQSEAVEEHKKIIDAINANDKDEIINTINEHVKHSKENYESILNNDTGMWIRMINTLKS